ncbi:sensor histidine kinase [Actinomycetes bacterium M1A6_2h]
MDAPAISASTPRAIADSSAALRITRQYSAFVGLGYLFYLVALPSTIAQSFAVMDVWWSALALPALFGPGIAMGLMGWRSPARRLRRLAAVTVGACVVMLALWPLGWNGGLIPNDKGMYFSQFIGLTGLAAAAAWRPRWTFAVLIVVVVAAATINHEVRAPGYNGTLFPEIAFSFAFSIVPVAAGIMGIRTAGVLDRTRNQAFADAAQTGAVRARADERRRFDELTHDSVMSTLLAAAREGSSKALSQQASRTLDAIDDLQSGADDDQDLTAAQSTAVIQAVVAAVDPGLRIEVDDRAPGATFPAGVIRTLASATSEALRNSVVHAGIDSTRSVDVTIGAGPAVLVDIADDGLGFDPAAVPPHRLGIAVSIHGRLAQLTGGSSSVVSRPGSGTRVSVSWTAPS